MRALKIAGAATACLIAIGLVLLATGIPSSFITSLVQDRIERDTGYRIAINGKTGIGVWPSLSVVLHNVTLENPRNGAGDPHLAVGEVHADLPFASLLSGTPKVSELTIDHPTLRLPMLRERTRANTASHPAASDNGSAHNPAFPIDRVTVSNGTIVFFDPDNHNHSENRVDDLDAKVTIGTDRQINVTGNARPGSHPLTFTIKAAPPAGVLGRQNIPTELTIDAPGMPMRKLTAKADIRINGHVLLINGLSGLLGDGAFNGWASVDFDGKPLVKVDLDFQRLGLGSGKPAIPSAQPSGPQPWSDAPIDISGLNYVDAQIKISAAELTIGDARLAPAAIDATIASGVLKATFSRLGAYDGEINGTLSADASKNNPAYALQAEITGVRALPLLSGLADFDNVDGKMQAKADVRGTGNNLRTILSSLEGTASADVRDGAIRNLNIAKMIRGLTSGTLSGWQERADQATDLSQLSATATIAQGKATTSDLFLSGPLVRMTGAGTVDLGSKTLAFRVEPKLVLTTEGQGGSANPVGLGIPVIVQGTWSEPRIYPDVAGILDNPGAAYTRLRELGQGLFGQGGTGSSDKSGTSLGDTLGTMLQQGLGGGAAGSGSATGGQPSQTQPSQGPSSQGRPLPLDDIMKRLFGR